MADMLLMPTGH
ncbi:unnamed protein product, partial [Didymodactylos carnosus]